MGACNRKQDLCKEDNIHKIQYELLKSTDGYDKIPIVTLEQAVLPLIPLLPTIQTYVRIVKEKCENPADRLTSDESASIMLYSIGWQPMNECLYVVLNTTLQSMNRQNLKPWFLYLKLLFSAVIRLPSIHLNVYRISKSALIKQYQKDEVVVWWDFALCTTSIEYLQTEKSLDKLETRTIFTIECNTIKDIRKHTYFSTDNSLLILPGTHFKVHECLEQDNNVHLITLQENQSSFLLQTQTSHIKSKNFLRKFLLCQKESKRFSTSPKTSVSNNSYRNTSLEQLIFESGRGWTVDLDEQNITDQDIKYIVKHAIIKNRCKRIRLRDNNITSLGALTLAEGLNNNIALETLDLRNNFISDIGVKSLALAIINSNLKTLNLESNGITTEGAPYLAQMLENNRTLTELYLSKNHLGDRGVELLANVLNDEKKNHHDQDNKGVHMSNPSTLQHLYLGHNDITDIGMKHLADMLKTNRMLTWLWLSGNEIGNQGVELLADTLAYHNSSLEWLFLNSNKAISDPSVDALVHMLKRNHSLKTIYINNCNLSEIAKNKLQEMIKSKKDFDLEV
ncbi:unnamed protein product [Rotaria sp. Silwood1]|nr:unnamed protein product [Rotaria sp. Silwood1]CAF1224749.1 unnamed protein product [Rotaria sp. Silwood1]CAF3489428.1 unnamed protein product [Rotaria sp. Silwood1]